MGLRLPSLRAGHDLRLSPRRRLTLEKVVTELFPGGDLTEATFWTGLRPMTPDGTPIVGATAGLLQDRYGLGVESFNADPQAQPGVVNIRLTLGRSV